MLELRVKAGRRHVPLYDLPMRLGTREACREIGDAVEGLIAFLDDLGGDPDSEPNGDDEAREADGDTRDAAYIEWDQLRGALNGGPNIAGENEDAEPGGDEQDGNFAEDEVCAEFARMSRGPGCIIADPDEAVDDKGCDPDEGF